MNNKQQPILDFTFLHELDSDRNRVTYARITSLTIDNYPIERIEGVVTAGSINLDGDSAVRRVCSLTLTTGNFNIHNVYWGLTTRVKIEIGIQNHLYGYEKYDDIIWFNQGVYVLTEFSTSAQVNNYTISLSGKDKMCLLNGDVGGSFNAETVLDSERVEQEDGSWVDEKRPIFYIIREMVHHYAQEGFHNIIIKDIDNLSLQVLKNYKTTFYLIESVIDGSIVDIYYLDNDITPKLNNSYIYADNPTEKVNFKNLPSNFKFQSTVDEDDIRLNLSSDNHDLATIILDEENWNEYIVLKIEYGEDIGYRLTETYYPEELIAAVGDTVTSILDKIVDTFGDFEYFYNLDGQFVFQAKQTYVNTSWDNRVTIEKETYIAPALVSSKVKYTFEGSALTSAYQNAPNLGDIKNDFTVWGKKKNSSGIETPIHMRYAIDLKPEYYKTYSGEIFVSRDFVTNCGDKLLLKEATRTGEYSQYIDDNENIYYQVDWREIIYQMQKDYYQHNHDDDFTVQITRNNLNTIIENKNYYIHGRTGYEQYYHDIEGFWRLLYAPEEYLKQYDSDNPKNPAYSINVEDFYESIIDSYTGISTMGEYIGPWNKNIILEPSSLIFWFDFFDADNLGLGQFSIPAIGDRPKDQSNDNIRALIYKDIPDVAFIIGPEDEEAYDEARRPDRITYIKTGVNDNDDGFIAKCVDEGTIRLSNRSITAQETIDDLLYNHAYCNETITITSVPIYYLDTNIIISAEDEQRRVNGYYIVNKISLPLDYKGTMSITAIKVPERIY